MNVPGAPGPESRVLKRFLDALRAQFNPSHISPDPLETVRERRAPEDREVAALIAAVFAYGGVRQIVATVRDVLEALGPSPREGIERLTASRALQKFDGFRHRFHGAADLARLLLAMRRVLLRHGSLGAFFLKGDDPTAPTIAPGLEAFCGGLLAMRFPAVDRWEAERGDASHMSHLLSRPSGGSACKRMNLFLRWVVRPADGVDLGLWPEVDPARLILPLDTHTWRIARHLGLTARKTPDWRSAEEITAALRVFDPADPVSYDFALSRLGILGFCRTCGAGRPHPECPLGPECGQVRDRR